MQGINKPSLDMKLMVYRMEYDTRKALGGVGRGQDKGQWILKSSCRCQAGLGVDA